MKLAKGSETLGHETLVDDACRTVRMAGAGKFRMDIGDDHRLHFSIEEWRKANAEVESCAYAAHQAETGDRKLKVGDHVRCFDADGACMCGTVTDLNKGGNGGCSDGVWVNLENGDDYPTLHNVKDLAWMPDVAQT